MATKRRKRAAQCGQKIRFPNPSEAHQLRKVLESKEHDKMDVYHCPFCLAWHVGHRAKRIRYC